MIKYLFAVVAILCVTNAVSLVRYVAGGKMSIGDYVFMSVQSTALLISSICLFCALL